MPQVNNNERISGLPRYETIIRSALFPPLIALALLAIILLWLIGSLLSANDLVDKADIVLNQSHETIKKLVDMETGERGYMVGGDPKFLLPYKSATYDITHQFAALEQTVPDDPAQMRRVKEIRRLYSAWVINAEYEITLRNRTRGGPEAIAYFNKGKGKELMDDIRKQFDALDNAEDALHDERRASAQIHTQQALIGGTLITLLVGGLLGIVTRREMRELSELYEGALRSEQEAKDYLGTTLLSIGDAVMVTDAWGKITRMNPVAEALTGWTVAEAQGKSSKEVFDILNEDTREVVESPVERVLRDGIIVALTNHTILRRRDGFEIAIDDSGAPIRDARGNLIGVVLVFRDVSERRRIEDRQRRVAETLQRSLLSIPPEDVFPHMRFTTVYVPAQAEAELGGDFYDIFPIDEARVAFAVGDVTGKGLEAASFTAEVKFGLRAILRQSTSPADALTRLNRYLTDAQRFEQRPQNSLVSMALAVLNTQTGEVSCSLAGAEPALILRGASRTVSEVGATGPLLGADTDGEFRESSSQMEQGDLLLIVTDGVTEARRGREFFGLDGVSAVIVGTEKQTLESLAESVVSASREFAGGKLRDDVCILLAQRKSDSA